ncbi:uncharacterized protein LOC113855679 [Abrus precatorius]|uniref:Uncharacterized protein LOC113855679 n=1 Tax=Abrus precatorius TaxID=3816 RepID=A0A8B8KH19_ABRPR|nr:uncharacterized protein LOC113855679 [Abrus precatorius]
MTSWNAWLRFWKPWCTIKAKSQLNRGLSAFTRHNPPKFEGRFNPEGAQRWVADVEKIFYAMGCREENKHGDGEEDLCAQFEHGLRPDIRAAVSVFQLTDLPTLVSKSRIFEANSRGKTVDTRGTSPVRQDRRPHRFSRGSYSGSNSSQSRGSSSQEKSSGSGSGSSSFRGPLKCFRCGGPHMVKDCPQPRITCSNSGKLGHVANECWPAKRSGRASASQRPESRGSTGQKPSIPGRVFAMSGVEASQSKELIQGKCIIKGRLLDMLFKWGATHSFISVDCMKSLGLYVTELPCNVVVTTSTGKPIVMSWLAANHVLLDYREKTLIFGATMAEVPRLMSQGAWENTVNAKTFMVMFLMEVESVVELEYIPMVRDFLEVFPKDVFELPPEREIEFAIDLIPRTSPIFVAPYRMSPVELAEVKKQVEDLLQKRL